MAEKEKMVCPECEGRKVIKGTCVCDDEWRGSHTNTGFDECQCMPETTCPNCNGTGYVEPSKTCHD